MDRERAMQIRVGFFVLMAFVIFLVTVFVLGREKNLFKHHVKLYAYFSGISGLKPSAPVRLAGVDIGTVSAIELPGKPGDKLIRVTLKLNDDVMNHIRADSEASIDSQGLLGDKLINISIGSAESPTIKDGATIKSLDVPDLSKVIDTGREALENIRQITRDLKKTVSGLSTEAVQGDLKDIIHTVSMMTRGVVDGPGLLHDIIFDKKLQDEGH
ncbi:MAG: MlaD family protein, partial [Myxococcota bacterium]